MRPMSLNESLRQDIHVLNAHSLFQLSTHIHFRQFKHYIKYSSMPKMFRQKTNNVKNHTR